MRETGGEIEVAGASPPRKEVRVGARASYHTERRSAVLTKVGRGVPTKYGQPRIGIEIESQAELIGVEAFCAGGREVVRNCGMVR